MPPCLPACLPARLRAPMPACLPACAPACPPCLPACLPACLRACVPPCLPACVPARLRAPHACVPACVPACEQPCCATQCRAAMPRSAVQPCHAVPAHLLVDGVRPQAALVQDPPTRGAAWPACAAQRRALSGLVCGKHGPATPKEMGAVGGSLPHELQVLALIAAAVHPLVPAARHHRQGYFNTYGLELAE